MRPSDSFSGRKSLQLAFFKVFRETAPVPPRPCPSEDFHGTAGCSQAHRRALPCLALLSIVSLLRPSTSKTDNAARVKKLASGCDVVIIKRRDRSELGQLCHLLSVHPARAMFCC